MMMVEGDPFPSEDPVWSDAKVLDISLPTEDIRLQCLELAIKLSGRQVPKPTPYQIIDQARIFTSFVQNG